MFTKSAPYYDLIYGWKNYGEEVGSIVSQIHRLHPEAKSLLDVACGSGEHARFLQKVYDVDGIDLDAGLLKLASRKDLKGEFLEADMRNFNMGKTYDIVMCLFSSIGYLTEGEEVVKALKCFKKHLAPDGFILVEPWFTPDDWKVGRPHMLAVGNEDVKVCRANVSAQLGHMSSIFFHYLIAHKGAGDVEHFTEEHLVALYTRSEMDEFFASAGLSVRYEEGGICGRGLYVAQAE